MQSIPGKIWCLPLRRGRAVQHRLRNDEVGRPGKEEIIMNNGMRRESLIQVVG